VEAPVGSTVTITVSTGPEQTEVPNVEGEEEDTAQQILEDEGFQVQVEDVDGPPPLDGTVVDQDPEGGTEANEGSTVTIFVARFNEEEGD
jgi:serine/threonine-protein kinase